MVDIVDEAGVEIVPVFKDFEAKIRAVVAKALEGVNKQVQASMKKVDKSIQDGLVKPIDRAAVKMAAAAKVAGEGIQNGIDAGLRKTSADIDAFVAETDAKLRSLDQTINIRVQSTGAGPASASDQTIQVNANTIPAQAEIDAFIKRNDGRNINLDITTGRTVLGNLKGAFDSVRADSQRLSDSITTSIRTSYDKGLNEARLLVDKFLTDLRAKFEASANRVSIGVDANITVALAQIESLRAAAARNVNMVVKVDVRTALLDIGRFEARIAGIKAALDSFSKSSLGDLFGDIPEGIHELEGANTQLRELEASSTRAERSVGGIGAALRRAFSGFGGGGGIGGRITGFFRNFGDNFNASLTKKIESASKAIKAFTFGIGGLVTAVASAAPSLIPVLAAIGESAGSAFSAATAFSSLGLGFGAVKVGSIGLGGALKAQIAAQKELATTGKISADTQKTLDEALKNLAPSARSLVKTLGDLAPAWSKVRMQVQGTLFRGVGKDVRDLSDAFRPLVQKTLVSVADLLSKAARSTTDYLTSSEGVSKVKALFDGLRDVLARLLPGIGNIGKGLLTFFSASTGPAGNLADAFTRMGKAFSDFADRTTKSGQFQRFLLNAQNAAGALLKVFGGLGDVIGAVFSSNGGAARGTEQLKSLANSLHSLADVIRSPGVQKGISAISDTFNFVFGAVLNSAKNFIEGVGKVFDFLKPIVEKVAKFFEPLFKTLKNSGFLDTFAKSLGVLGAAAAGAAIAIGAISAVLDPVVLVVGAIAGAVAGLKTLYDHNEGFKKSVDGLANSIETKVIPVLKDMVTWFNTNILPTLKKVGSFIKDVLVDVFVSIGDTIKNKVIPFFKGFGQAILPGLKDLGKAIGPLVKSFGDLFSAILPVLKKIGPLFSAIFGGGAKNTKDQAKGFEVLGKIVGSVFGIVAKALANIVRDTARIIEFVAKVIQKFVEFGKAVGDAVDFVKKKIDDVVKFFQDLPGKIGQFFGALPGIIGTALGEAALPVTNFITGIPQMFSNGLGNLGSIVGQAFASIPGIVSSAMGAIPGIVQSALGGLGGIASSALGGLGTLISGFFTGIPGAISGALGGLGALVGGFFTGIPGAIAGALGGLGSVVSGAFRAAFSTVGGIVSGAINGIVGFFSGLPGRVGGALGGLGGVIGGTFRGALANGKAAVVGFAGDVVGIFRGLPGRIGGALGSLASNVRRVFSGLVSDIKGYFNGLHWHATIKIPSFIPGIGGKSATIGFARGGIITREMIARIGEGNRPEIIGPLSDNLRGRLVQILRESGVIDRPEVQAAAAQAAQRRQTSLSGPSVVERSMGWAPTTPAGNTSVTTVANTRTNTSQVIRQQTINQTFNLLPGADPITHAQQVAARIAAAAER